VLIVYSTTDCGYCSRLKSQLDPHAAEYVASVNNGNQVVPTVRFPNGTVLTNPTVAELKACLATPAPG
jgi:mycoredoxin